MSTGKKWLVFPALLPLFLFGARPANAQVFFWGVQKTQFYTQTTDNTPPSITDGYSVFAFANTTSNNDANSFTVSDNNSFTLTSAPTNLTSFAGSDFPNPDTKDQMDVDPTSGSDYIFTAIGGNLDGQTDMLPISADAYPFIPYLTGTDLSSALAINPNSDHIFHVGYSGMATDTLTSINIYDQSGNNIYQIYGNPQQGTFTLPASFLQTLVPGQTYLAQLTDFNTSDEGTSGAFSGATNSDGFTQSTNFNLRVVPVVPATPAWGLVLTAAGLLIAARHGTRKTGLR